MLPLLSAVLIASLLGSVHCAGMCGGFMLFAVGASGPEAPASKGLLHGAYHFGRLTTYLALGAIAGATGAALDIAGDAVGLQRIATGVAGALMIVFGLTALLRSAGVRLPRAPMPPALVRIVQSAHRRAAGSHPIARALIVGLSTTLLPCGWLYAFAATAAGTAHPLLGALTMAVFWVGTLPIMAALGVGLAALTGPLRRRLPLATSGLIVVVGVYTLCARISIPAGDGPAISASSEAPSLAAAGASHCQP